MADLPAAKLGFAICYDVRFPQLFRAQALAGAEVLTAPAAFTRQTGEAHWHVLLRARAIENGAFVIAAAQGGLHEDGRETYGHSMIVDPWGRVVAEAGGTTSRRSIYRRDRHGGFGCGAQEDPQPEERARVRGGGRSGGSRGAEGRVLIRFSPCLRPRPRFEGWFRSNDDFEAQKKRGLVDCPACGSHKVEKALMAPAVSTGRKSEKIALAMGEQQSRRWPQLKALSEKMRENADYVGDKFAEEARKIHFGEAEQRGIYGEATPDEAREPCRGRR